MRFAGSLLIAFSLFGVQWVVAEEADFARLYEYGVQEHGGQLKLAPDFNEYVSRVGQKVAAIADGERSYTFTILNKSAPDMWSLPGGYVVVTRGLLRFIDNEAELAALLSHEVQHAKEIYGQAIRHGLPAGVSVSLGQSGNHAMEDALSVLARIERLKHDRIAELTADRLGQIVIAKAGYDPGASLSLLDGFLKGKSDSLFYLRHPPTEERVQRVSENIPRIAYRLKIEGGELGEQAFVDAYKLLGKSAEAYEFADVARTRVTWNALAMLDKAIALLPTGMSEPAFHSQKAALLAEELHCDGAMRELDISLQAEPSRYLDHVLRAQCLQLVGQLDEALESYARSYDLLPNTEATESIAALSKLMGTKSEAKRNYLKLMSVRYSGQQRANREFSRLDLTDNPQNYFNSQSTLMNGELVSVISNLSGTDVSKIKIRFFATIDSKDYEKEIQSGPLPDGARVLLAPGWQVASEDSVSNMRVRVIQVSME